MSDSGITANPFLAAVGGGALPQSGSKAAQFLSKASMVANKAQLMMGKANMISNKAMLFMNKAAALQVASKQVDVLSRLGAPGGDTGSGNPFLGPCS